MVKKYIDRRAVKSEIKCGYRKADKSEIAAYILAVVHNCDWGIDVEENILELYNSKQKDTYKDEEIYSELGVRQKGELVRLFEEYKDIFSYIQGMFDQVKQEIHVTSPEPTRSKVYPMPYHLQKELDREIETMLNKRLIERSESAYTVTLVVVEKLDGFNSLCCNYKQLNKTTVFDPEPIMSNKKFLISSQVF